MFRLSAVRRRWWRRRRDRQWLKRAMVLLDVIGLCGSRMLICRFVHVVKQLSTAIWWFYAQGGSIFEIEFRVSSCFPESSRSLKPNTPVDLRRIPRSVRGNKGSLVWSPSFGSIIRTVRVVGIVRVPLAIRYSHVGIIQWQTCFILYDQTSRCS